MKSVSQFTASYPFNKSNADLILRSSDAVEFRVRKAILAEASPIFEDMLSIPQPPNQHCQGASSSRIDLPLVGLTESSTTLYYLLGFCYPIENPQIASVEHAFAVLEAARKYMMDYVVSQMQQQFATLAERDPLRTYAMACSRGWEDEMRIAARASLSRPLEDGADMAELESISAGAYLRLRAYHRTCRKVVMSLHYCGWDGGKRVWFPKRSKKHVNIDVESWCVEYMEAARQVLQSRPCGATVLAPEIAYKFLVDIVSRLSLSEKTRVIFDLRRFTSDLAQRVEEAVAQVRWQIVQSSSQLTCSSTHSPGSVGSEMTILFGIDQFDDCFRNSFSLISVYPLVHNHCPYIRQPQ